MTVWNLGSINADFVYSVPHIPEPGETLGSTGRRLFLGGKGANMSVAAARAGATVRHIGAVGEDGRWAIDRLKGYGVGTDDIAVIEVETAQAIIMVDPQGENSILLHHGANFAVPFDRVQAALAHARPGDWLVAQNETTLQAETLALGKERGLRIAYAAAPFSARAVQDVLPLLDFLILNDVEARQLQAATGLAPADLPVADVIVTRGGDGATWFGAQGAVDIPPVLVTPVDTTGAGDTFTGYVLAGLDLGQDMADALSLAARAGALMVTRHGTSDVIPTLEEVRAFRP
ncbi:ribokinase [Loktanella sp. IMCC34160]|uniref:ribokinase n=1 Tax=Loktanella sp. IMCC34160 TaxID=2510646 RepID=UPI00101C04AC|nr:ribokinase [Loktanella sp. IMCC34160]RYG91337.1 ribokinase [Loktanella sp. IMCC34160]